MKFVDIKSFQRSRSKKKNPFQKHKEEQEKRRRREEAEANEVLGQFVASFSEKKTGQTFVRGGKIVVEDGKSEFVTQTNKEIYKPETSTKEPTKTKTVSKIPNPIPVKEPEIKKPNNNLSSHNHNNHNHIQNNNNNNYHNNPPKGMPKRRQIDDFMEELKRTQETRERLRQLKDKPKARLGGMRSDGFDREEEQELSTNLYVGNLSPQVNEEILYNAFSKFGSIASWRILWPRTDEERHRPTNSGFVCFVNRKDAEKALAELDAIPFYGKELRINWGRAMPQGNKTALPQGTVPHILPNNSPSNMSPPILSPINQPISGNLMSPLPLSVNPGMPQLPFANPMGHNITVVFPEERSRSVIDFLIPYVIQDGAKFERMLIERENNNPLFSFLFNLGSPSNMYYRWRVYSILQGDTFSTWKIKPFQMFKGGPLWIPPPIPEQSASNSSLKETKDIEEPKYIDFTTKYRGKALNEAERDQIEHILRKLSIERESIKDAMVFCLDHSESAPELVEVISESLTIFETPVLTKVARLFLVSDILHNAAGVPNGSLFRTAFDETLEGIFTSFREKYESITGRITQQNLKERVLKVLRVWSDWCVYPQDRLKLCYDSFLSVNKEGRQRTQRSRSAREFVDYKEGDEIIEEDEEPPREPPVLPTLDDTYNEPVNSNTYKITDDDIDGVPLGDDDIDGEPMEDELKDESKTTKDMSEKSKWDKDDDIFIPPETEGIQEEKQKQFDNNKDKNITVIMNDDKRELLRQLEIQVQHFADNLETQGKTRAELDEQVEDYRSALTKKLNSGTYAPEKHKHTDEARGRESKKSDKRKLSNSRSGSRGRKRQKTRSKSPKKDSRYH